MALRIHHIDGSTNTITDEELRQIDEHNRGRSLAEIAAEPPAFAHLLRRSDPRPAISILDYQQISGESLRQIAGLYAVSDDGTDEQIRNRIMAKLRRP